MMWIAALAAPILGVAEPRMIRESLGIFDRWGAFADSSPERCFAITQAVRSEEGPAPQAFVSVATWPGRAARNQLYVKLSRDRDSHAGVTLSVGDRRFSLVAGKAEAWAADARTDAAVVAAIRSGRSMSVETLDRRGQAFADIYSLRGAATAIDASAVSCVGR